MLLLAMAKKYSTRQNEGRIAWKSPEPRIVTHEGRTNCSEECVSMIEFCYRLQVESTQ
jgi:hypothetical protein